MRRAGRTPAERAPLPRRRGGEAQSHAPGGSASAPRGRGAGPGRGRERRGRGWKEVPERRELRGARLEAGPGRGAGPPPGVESGSEAGEGWRAAGEVEARRADAGDRGAAGGELGEAVISRLAQVLFNVGAAQCRLGLWAAATRSLEEALSKGPAGAGDDLHAALGQLQVRGQGRAAAPPVSAAGRGATVRSALRRLPRPSPRDQGISRGRWPVCRVWGWGRTSQVP